ncbi:hypothetical protein I545_0462 [Mycobacterium kansasii 662]|uniref:Uncharacterized protein n=2 Tax=Mycobacterium kansasii TaxID=1768 RepID=A0A1V3XVW2_MYCKA|nr:hypothetical protein I547_0919 [Mycobacterium kansasii 824]EUA21410.1 hypothetical protein I545_0462 [Mycobacterium kansasii 662]OOK82514.1 hypothetical protein BZL30_1438 [Mycobacterium kansasii]OOK83334.1 hypothetical protein BZL29_0512 [Mycobacterium kansasii]
MSWTRGWGCARSHRTDRQIVLLNIVTHSLPSDHKNNTHEHSGGT